MKKENQITQESESFIERDYVQFSFLQLESGARPLNQFFYLFNATYVVNASEIHVLSIYLRWFLDSTELKKVIAPYYEKPSMK